MLHVMGATCCMPWKQHVSEVIVSIFKEYSWTGKIQFKHSTRRIYNTKSNIKYISKLWIFAHGFKPAS